MRVLEGKYIADNIKKDFENRIRNLKKKPNIAILAMDGNAENKVYMEKIKINCKKYNIECKIFVAQTEQEFKNNFEQVNQDISITGIMFQKPLPAELENLIDQISPEKDIEGIGVFNMGKLFLGKDDALIPCTSKAIIETLDGYDIDLQGKNVVVIGKSNIVGKPLIPQLLSKGATVTVCHSRTVNLQEHTCKADVIIIAIGKSNFLKKEDIKKGAILIDVGINYEDGKIVGDIDYEDISGIAGACTPVPGGIGTVTNAVLIDNIIKSCEMRLEVRSWKNEVTNII